MAQQPSDEASSPLRRVVYHRRWYILFVYSFAGFIQGYFWNMWGPIYSSMHYAFDWDESQLALMPLYGTICFIVCVLPSAWMLEKYGLRKIVLWMTFLTAVSAVMRCIPLTSVLGLNVIINLSAVCNGIPGAVTFYLPAYISARWFPPNQRKISTAIGTLLNMLGIACSFLFGPLLVPDMPDEPNVPKNVTDVQEVRHWYFVYTYIQSACAGALFLAVLVYYPDAPPTPPSASAQAERINYIMACKTLLRSRDFWQVSIPFILTFGIYSGWQSVLDVNLKANNVSQIQSGWIGFYLSLSGAGIGILMGKVGDYFGQLKAIQIGLCVLCAEAALWLTLLCDNFLPFTLRGIYPPIILLGTATSCLMPINFEFMSDLCYPVDEAVVVGLSGLLTNLPTSVFLLILFFDKGSVAWMNYMLVISCGLSVPLACVIREKYRRTQVDDEDNASVVTVTPDSQTIAGDF